jgi:ketosteroid isomerase-like protein
MADSIEQAHQEFYTALNELLAGDATPMRAIISESPEVTLTGPFGGTQRGPEVMASFEEVAAMKLGGTSRVSDLSIVEGDEIGYTICVENGMGMSVHGEQKPLVHRATNIFRREAGGWRMIHHHTDPSAD